MEVGWKVIVADELRITRRAIATAIRGLSERHEVVECATPEEADQMLDVMDPTLLLVDLRSPGLPLVTAARERCPGVKIVVLTGYDLPEDALEALKAGADGFLVKGMHPEELLNCLRCVVETGVVVTSRVVKRALNRPLERPTPVSEGTPVALDESVVDVLTPREREIFVLMARNCSNKEIASSLHIAEQTVKVHVSRILAKLGQPNRAQAVIHGLRTSRNDSKVVHFRGMSR